MLIVINVFLTFSSTSMVCWLLPVTQFHSQVSVLSSKPEDLSHSTQQAAHPHGHCHTKQAICTDSADLSQFNLTPFKVTEYLDHKHNLIFLLCADGTQSFPG